MKSGYNIEWTDEAINNLDSIIDYLTIRWTDKEIRNFFKKLDRHLKVISTNPLSFPISDLMPNVRRCVLSSQTTIYYKLKIDQVVILSVFCNSQDTDSIILT